MRRVLDRPLQQRIDPPRRQVQHDLKAKEERFATTRQHRRVQHAVECPQRARAAHEQHLLDPELRGVLEPHGRVGADADAAPDDAQQLQAQEAVRPRLQLNARVGEGEHPGEGTEGREDDGCEGPGGVDSTGGGQAEYFAEEEADQAELVGPPCVPKDPARAELEWFGILADLAEKSEPCGC